ncbi:MAG TPA: bifunctional nuclease domain-containing protein [Geobacteraceae bacterium]|nr:bifunctional nuclease domain-containing protein [Geobacteraceae bacterium]
MYHEMKVFGFTLDTLAQRPVVILKDAADANTVPIWISSQEAVSIVAELVSRDISTQNGRDDLLSLLLDKMSMSVARVSIDSLNDGLFSAAVIFHKEEGDVRIDVRPYEALIISLKYKLPVMVAEEVMARASMWALSDETIASENDARRFVDFLESLDPADLGKYPM